MSFERPLPLNQLDEAVAPLRRVLASGERASWLAQIVRPRLGALPREHLPTPVTDLLDEIDGRLDGLGEPDGRAVAWAAVCRLDALLGLPQAAPLRPVARKLDAGAGTTFPTAGGAEPDVSPSGALDLGGEARVDELGLPSSWVEALTAAGVETVADLLWLPPTFAEALGPVHGAGRVPADGDAAVGGRVVARGTVHHADGRQSLRVLLQGAGPTRAEVPVDGLPEVDLLRSMLVCGNRAVLAGRADAGVLRDAWLVGDEPKAAARRVRWGIPGLPDLAVRTALQKAAGRLGAVADALPATVVSALAVPSAAEAWAGAAVADGATRERLEAEELLHAQLGLCWARFAPGRERGISHTVGSSLPARVFDAMGLDHSVAVATAAERIRRDLRRSAPMRRVLVGSPGSGPWRTALWSLLSVVESKAQAVVLSDDFALMEEMFAAFEEALRDADVACRLVGGPPTTGVRGALKRGEIGVVFGTADLLDPALEWRRLGLVVSIERSPSGASARQVASLRAPRPDLLVLAGSAPTPAQALGLLGDHDFTILPEPESNPRVRVYADAGRAAAVGEVAEVLAARRRAVMIIPQVEGRDVFGRREAHEMAAALQAELFPGRRMGLYHGAMSREERASARRDLAQGRVDLLLATSLVEEGGPIDGVGAVLVEQADRIDPARLERIRRLASRPESRLVFVVGDAAELRSFEARVSSPTFEGRVPPSDEAGGTPPVLRWNRSASLARIAFVRDIATRLLADDPGLRRAPDLARTLRSRWGDLWPADEDDDKGFPCPVTEVGSAGSGRRRRKRRRR